MIRSFIPIGQRSGRVVAPIDGISLLGQYIARSSHSQVNQMGMPAWVKTTHFGRIGLIEALEGFVDVNRGQRDEAATDAIKARSECDFAGMSTQAQNANHFDKRIKAAQQFIETLRALKPVTAPDNGYVIPLSGCAMMMSDIQTALEVYIDLLADQCRTNIKVEKGRDSVTIIWEQLEKIQKEQSENTEKLIGTSRLLGGFDRR